MDYGVLYTMGKVKVSVDNTLYECARYRIADSESQTGKNKVKVLENSIIISKENSTKQFILQNIKKV